MSVSMLEIDRLIDMTNEQIKSQYSTGLMFGEEEGMGSLSVEEVISIHTRLGAVASNPYVFSVLWEMRKSIYDVVRAVKASINSRECEFAGEYAEGRQLNLDFIMPNYVKKSGTPLTTWLQTVSEGVTYFESDENDTKITLGYDEGRVYGAWVDTIDSPKLVRAMYVLPKQNIIVSTPFNECNDYPIIRHKAVKLYPRDAYAIKVRYDSDGDDMAAPIGVIVTTAEKFETMF